MKTAPFVSAALLLTSCLSIGFAKQTNREPDAATVEFFEKKVRPVLSEQCFACHGPTQQKGALRLDSLAALLKGNSAGPAVVAGSPEKSPLIQVVHYDGKVKMPPAGKLSADAIANLTAWIKMGAPWPGVKPEDAAKQAAQSKEWTITPEAREHWSFKAVTKPVIPAVKNRTWVVNDIDRFILSGIEKKGFIPAPAASRPALIRRAYLDITGLPPSVDEIEAFVKDVSPNAWQDVVDRLLASPQYGERWARLWMDVARFADTRGYNFVDERTYKDAYTFRDYLIRAFNSDLPYDQFLIHQLAADKLDLGDDRWPLAAMGYLTVGRRFLNNQNDIIDDRIDVVSRGMLGLTAACARCHNHKYDPISMKDYYSLYGVFASSQEPNPPLTISPKAVSRPYEEHAAKLAAATRAIEGAILDEIERLRKLQVSSPTLFTEDRRVALQLIRLGAQPNPDQYRKLEPMFSPAFKTKLAALRADETKLKSSLPPKPEFAMAMIDNPSPHEPRIFVRGNPNNPGAQVKRAFFEVLSDNLQPVPFTDGSGRLELARKIASPANPLTARVMVNRIWRHHFGTGIVRTPSDFGTRGDHPTHPELLDYLASRFVEQGWSIKKIHREILLSNTYKQSADNSKAVMTADPENRLYARMNRRRMDLEQMRDSLLLVSGKLDLKQGGPSVDIVDNVNQPRRTLYGFIDRQNLPGLFRTFDLASPDSSSPQRFTTTVPQQALFLMNSPFMKARALELSARREIQDCKSWEEKIRAAYRIVFSRNPDLAEIKIGLTYLAEPQGGVKTVGIERNGQSGDVDNWSRYLQALMMTNEFIFID